SVSPLPAPYPTYYPKPSISLRPSGGVALGGAVTLQCRGLHQNMRFLLYKDGNPNALQDAEPAGDVTWFPIRNVSRRDAGSYSCRYSTKSDPPVWSEPSDPVELVVAELRYPKPSISLRPSSGVALGGAVTIRCRGSHQNMRFLLHKFGNPNVLQDVVLAGNVAEFPICNISRKDAGRYRCYYCSKSDPPIWSEPSDHVKLVIAGEGPGSGAFPRRMFPRMPPLWGRTEESGPRGCPAGSGPSTEFTPHQPGQIKPKETLGHGLNSVTVSVASSTGPRFLVPSLPHLSQRSFSSHRGNRPSWAPAAGSAPDGAGGRR
uniref:Ig-like domain-containing protein n=1 Tax=Terrapene triunguis TaxID=2587831 RepID=A0A674JP61_9SAUR